MPVICRIYGIAISIYFSDHSPPHFHARFQAMRIIVEIEAGRLIRGSFSRRHLNQLENWRKLHVAELMENWHIAQRRGEMFAIED